MLDRRRAERAVRFGSLLVGTASIATACWLLDGVTGVLLALAVAITTAASARYYGVAMAHLLLLALASTPTLLPVALLEAGSFAYLAPELDIGSRATDGVLLAVAIVVFTGGVSAVVYDFGTLWAGATLAVVTCGLGYLMHRYGALRLGLLTEDGT